jgi:hypothetical protein
MPTKLEKMANIRHNQNILKLFCVVSKSLTPYRHGLCTSSAMNISCLGPFKGNLNSNLQVDVFLDRRAGRIRVNANLVFFAALRGVGCKQLL